MTAIELRELREKLIGDVLGAFRNTQKNRNINSALKKRGISIILDREHVEAYVERAGILIKLDDVRAAIVALEII